MQGRHVAALVVLAAVVLAGCSTPDAYREWRDRQGSGPEGTVVHMDRNAFVRERITVPVGTTVTWVQNDTVTHTVTFEDGSYDEEVPPRPGATVERTFDETGTFDYRCKPHSTGYRNWEQMVGRVTVVDG